MYVLERNISHRGVPELLLIVACVFTFFVHNGAIYPDAAESSCLVSAYEMAENGDWISPTINGEITFEHPPFPIWISALVEMVSPGNLVLHRCFAGLMALIMTLMLYYLTAFQTKSKFVGLAAGAVFATSINVILISRMAMWDIYCHSFMLGAILCFMHGYERQGKNFGWFVSAGLLMGLSFLSKGPVAIYTMLLPFMIAYFSVFRRSGKEFHDEHKFWPLVVMVIVGCVVGFWWYVVAYISHPKEFVESCGIVVFQWFTDRVRPWYYYWQFIFECGLWCIFFVMSLHVPYWMKHLGHKRQYLSAVVWCFTGLILLSFIPEKNPRFLLPILVPMSQMVGHILYFWGKCAKDYFFPDNTKLVWNINSCLLGILVLISPISNYILLYRTSMIPLGFFVVSSLLLVACGAFLIGCSIKKYVFGFCCSVLFFFMCVSVYVLPSIADLFSVLNKKGFEHVSEIAELKDVPFYCDDNESIRIEFLYEVRRNVKKNDFSTEFPKPPFAVIHSAPIESIISKDKVQNYKVKEVGRFNDNYRIEREILHDKDYYRTITLITE